MSDEDVLDELSLSYDVGLLLNRCSLICSLIAATLSIMLAEVDVRATWLSSCSYYVNNYYGTFALYRSWSEMLNRIFATLYSFKTVTLSLLFSVLLLSSSSLLVCFAFFIKLSSLFLWFSPTAASVLYNVLLLCNAAYSPVMFTDKEVVIWCNALTKAARIYSYVSVKSPKELINVSKLCRREIVSAFGCNWVTLGGKWCEWANEYSARERLLDSFSSLVIYLIAANRACRWAMAVIN